MNRKDGIHESFPGVGTALQANPAELLPSIFEALAASAVRYRERDYQNLTQELADAAGNLKNDSSASALLQYTGAVLPRFEAYQRSTQQYIDGLLSQFRGIIRSLISAVDTMRSGCQEFDWDKAEEKIARLQTVEEIAVVRENLEIALGECARSERARKQETSGLLTQLHERILILEEFASAPAPAPSLQERVKPVQAGVEPQETIPTQGPTTSPSILGSSPTGSSPTEGQFDRLTGLPNRDAAEAAIRSLETNPCKKYLAAFYIQNMQLLNVRFGERICDELLVLVTQRIVTSMLRPTDPIFRWRGPAFVAILDREESFSYVSHDLKRFVEHPFQFEFRSGSLLVFISVAAELVSGGGCSAAESVQQLEKFFSSF